MDVRLSLETDEVFSSGLNKVLPLEVDILVSAWKRVGPEKFVSDGVKLAETVEDDDTTEDTPDIGATTVKIDPTITLDSVEDASLVPG